MCVCVCVCVCVFIHLCSLPADNHLTDHGVGLLVEAMKKQVSATERGQGLLRLSVKVCKAKHLTSPETRACIEQCYASASAALY